MFLLHLSLVCCYEQICWHLVLDIPVGANDCVYIEWMHSISFQWENIFLFFSKAMCRKKNVSSFFAIYFYKLISFFFKQKKNAWYHKHVRQENVIFWKIPENQWTSYTITHRRFLHIHADHTTVWLTQSSSMWKKSEKKWKHKRREAF